MTASINESWSLPPSDWAISGTATKPEPQVPQPKMTVSGRPVDPATGQWADAPQSPVKGDTTVARAHARIEQGRKALAEQVDAIERQHRAGHITDEGARTQLAALANSEAAQGVNQAPAEVQAMRDEKAARVKALRDGLVTPGDAAQETRNSRFWERSKTTLAAQDPGKAAATAQQMIADATRAQLSVLLEELPSALEGRGVPADWIAGEIARRVPELGEAQSQLDTAEKALQATRYNATAVTKGFETGTPPTKLVDPARFDPDRPR